MYRMILQIRRIKILKDDAIDKVKLFRISISLISEQMETKKFTARAAPIFLECLNSKTFSL